MNIIEADLHEVQEMGCLESIATLDSRVSQLPHHVTAAMHSVNYHIMTRGYKSFQG